MGYKLNVLVAGALLGAVTATPVLGQQAAGLVDVSSLALPTAAAVTKADAGLAGASGEVEVVVRLAGAPLAIANGANSKRFGGALTRAQQADYSAKLRAAQSAAMSQIAALGGRELGRVQIAYNALIVRIDAAAIGGIAAMPTVESVKRVGEYRLDLAETVPYIGAAAVQSAGFDGAGVSVAVLDSGIDYTHRNLGGAGTLAAYQAAYGTGTTDPKNTTLDGLFPTAKVVGGFDFVGESWPNGARTEDPDPIDLEGHGTHVADIIAGRSTDGTHKGVAPGASLYAVKVCSAVASSCNGVALLKGMDFALDPNGDGAMDDAVDVVNMSLGSSYGQREDDLSFASANAVKAGVVVVASAGNSADRPYIVGSPSSTPEVISVAQTQVPSARSYPLVVNSPASIAGTYRNTETLSWAPLGTIAGDVVFAGRACDVDAIPSVAGKVALVDRGTCNISEKVRKVSNAGATGVLVGLVAAGDAITFSNGGQCPAVPDGTCKPGLVITQSTSNLVKAALNAGQTVNVTVTTSVFTALAGSMVGSSSRGPSYSYSAIKPDIGAPGASVSAIAGSGTGTEAFGGTSGAAPMVSGAAALLLQAFPNRTPLEIKAMLMNTANTTVYTNPATQPGVLAPITRIGGGEVRVNDAIRTPYAAWDSEDPSAGLSFGYRSIVADQTFKRSVVVKNYGGTAVTLPISPGFRYANDEASGAIEIKAPKTVSVPANGTATFTVMLKVNAAKLPAWNLGATSNQGNGALLQGVEFDGYLTLGSGSSAIRLPWQILPHKSAAVTASTSSVVLSGGVGSFGLSNSGATAGGFDVFALTGQSPKIQKFFQPDDGDNFALIDLKSAGVRAVTTSGLLAVQFAINTFGERAHPAYPAEFDVYVDSNNDGNYDYVLYTVENGTFASSGQTVVTVLNLATGGAVTRFFASADLNSGNMVMTALASDLGLTAASKFTFGVYAFDNYFTGSLTDQIENMTFTLGTPKYAAAIASGSVPVGGGGSIGVQAVPGGATASPSQTGLLLLYRDAKAKSEAETITITP